MDKEKYQEYLKSAHWQSVKAIKLFEAGYKCESCKSERRLEVHHKNYDCIGKETNEDLQVLCNFCHSEIAHAKDNTAKSSLGLSFKTSVSS